MISVYLIIKIFHLFGFIIAVGTTVASTVAYKYFWRQYDADRTRVAPIFQLIQGVQVAGMIGMITLLLAGITMLIMAEGAFTSMLWFQIKLGLIVLIFVNGLTLGRKTAVALKALVEQQSTLAPGLDVRAIKGRAQLFSILQLTIFASIIILSILRIT
jgi:hypothetical protein